MAAVFFWVPTELQNLSLHHNMITWPVLLGVRKPICHPCLCLFCWFHILGKASWYNGRSSGFGVRKPGCESGFCLIFLGKLANLFKLVSSSVIWRWNYSLGLEIYTKINHGECRLSNYYHHSFPRLVEEIEYHVITQPLAAGWQKVQQS